MTANATLFYGAIDLFPAVSPEQTDYYLTQPEQQRFKRMRPEVAKRFFLGRKLTKDALAQTLTCPAREIAFSYTSNGKPFINEKGCFFSISHSNSAVAVVIGDCELGLDVEQFERRSGNIAPPWLQPESFLHPHSAALVQRAESKTDKARVFTLLWTLMESRVKLEGSGIHRVLKSLAIDLDLQRSPMCAKVLEGANTWWQAWERPTGAADVVTLASNERDLNTEWLVWQGNSFTAWNQQPSLISATD